MKTEISVCIPLYNSARYVSTAISSALNQTFSDLELLIIDDFSTDESLRIVSKFSDRRLRVLRNRRNLGMVHNWNRCLSLARGRYVALLPSDDFMEPTRLEIQHEIMESDSQIGFAYSASLLVDDLGRRRQLYRPYRASHIWNGVDEFRRHALTNYVSFPTVMVRREVFSKVGLFDPDLILGPDWDMWLRIELEGYRVAYTTHPLASFRADRYGHRTSMSASIHQKPLLTFQEDCRLIAKTFRDELLVSRISAREAAILKRRALVGNAAVELVRLLYQSFILRQENKLISSVASLLLLTKRKCHGNPLELIGNFLARILGMISGQISGKLFFRTRDMTRIPFDISRRRSDTNR